MTLRITHLLVLIVCSLQTLLAQEKMGTVSLPAGTERRVAVVVGNRDYESLSPLNDTFMPEPQHRLPGR